MASLQFGHMCKPQVQSDGKLITAPVHARAQSDGKRITAPVHAQVQSDGKLITAPVHAQVQRDGKGAGSSVACPSSARPCELPWCPRTQRRTASRSAFASVAYQGLKGGSRNSPENAGDSVRLYHGMRLLRSITPSSGYGFTRVMSWRYGTTVWAPLLF